MFFRIGYDSNAIRFVVRILRRIVVDNNITRAAAIANESIYCIELIANLFQLLEAIIFFVSIGKSRID